MVSLDKKWENSIRDPDVTHILNQVADVQLFSLENIEFETEFYGSFKTSMGFRIIASGSSGGVYGFIQDTYPEIAFIGSAGNAGRIVGSIKEFLELVIFFPYWHRIFTPLSYDLPLEYLVQRFENDLYIDNPDIEEERELLSKYFSINKNIYSFQIVSNNLKKNPYFRSYSCIDGNPFSDFTIHHLK